MIDLRRLRALAAVAEHGTVTAAATALNFTPSAVSQQIGQLAHDLGTELLEHQGRRVHLTPAALILLTHANTIQAQWEQARAELAATTDSLRGTLRICGVSSAIAALAAPATTCLQARHSHLQVLLREEESADCYRLLLSDEADIALVLPTLDAPPPTDERFEQQPVLNDPQDLLLPVGHKLAQTGGVNLADAGEESWIVKRHDNDSYTLLSVACAAAGFTPNITHQAKEWYAVSALVAAGLGVCLLPRIVPIPASHAVIRVPLTGPSAPGRQILASVRRGSSNHPAIAAGVSVLRDVANDCR
ncbi:DNA-binding transcriptional regulator, LysR family [Brevibacterium sandarakinum]|uniref:DNA-binding transcriptional regulator, LysR family n=1 Tax=Brevibacterium sandarakinum TaxID=629680 RepID=A0A1H1NWH4_BRESA|nr:LysR family transcriptional regulator [Brevibacterium sandarakinum]SDS03328.1 DNA-binding transcriptional regulator, LysR family [Brevibacterium sandarakinum]